MEFKVNSGMWGMMFGVPCIVADNFLKLADEAQIKTLIYVLRNNNRICTSDEIARAIDEDRRKKHFYSGSRQMCLTVILHRKTKLSFQMGF